MLKKTSLLKSQINLLPSSVGVYIFFNKKSILYIGKSNNIRRRVSSYFKSSSEKSKIITSIYTSIDYILVDSEEDALFLENTLIKKHQPKYNVLLKDDKSFPWICVKNERFPRVFISRKRISNSDFYFGPYVSKKILNNIFFLIKENFPVRTCNYNLSEQNIINNKYNVCLEYHMKNCLGPCSGFQNEIDYNKNIESIKKILEGKYSFVLKDLNKKIKKFSKKLLFEKCESLKNQIISLKKMKNKSVVVSNKNINIDCFYIISLNGSSYVNFIRVVEGSVVYLNNYTFKNNLYYTDVSVLENFIKTIFYNYKNISRFIVSNIVFPNFLNKKVYVPKKGYKKDLLNFSLKNVLNYIELKNSNISVLNLLKSDLYLKKIPFHIECFDVSNLMGTNTVSSCVVFKNGKPVKSYYRSFIINNNNNIDDYMSISISIIKRYKNVLKKNIPNLIVIDGGKGQLKAAKKALKKLNLIHIDLISIAKKEEHIYLSDLKKIILNKKSDSLKLIQFLRDEAHRFCLSKHRLKRNNSFLKSELNNINLIGPKTIFKLLNEFKSINNIKKASKKDLINTLGLLKGNIIYKHFNN